MNGKDNVYEFLNQHQISYQYHEHVPVFTVEQAKELDISFEGTQCKNLFLRNKKGNKYYLLILEEHEDVKLLELSHILKESRLSFASPERLYGCMKVEPGAVGAFGLLNDRDNKVTVVLGRDLRKHKRITFHPNVNDATLAIAYEDFEKMLVILEKTIIQI